MSGWISEEGSNRNLTGWLLLGEILLWEKMTRNQVRVGQTSEPGWRQGEGRSGFGWERPECFLQQGGAGDPKEAGEKELYMSSVHHGLPQCENKEQRCPLGQWNLLGLGGGRQQHSLEPVTGRHCIDVMTALT